MTRLRALAFGLLTVAYPLLVYLAMGRFEPRWMALLLFALALLPAGAATTTSAPVVTPAEARAIAKARTARFNSADALIDDLEKARQQ